MAPGPLDVAFDVEDYKDTPVEKQASLLFEWLSEITTKLRTISSIQPDDQDHIVRQLSAMIDFAQQQKSQQMITKPIRTSVANILRLIYNSTEAKGLHEFSSKLLSYLSKVDRYSEVKHLSAHALGAINQTAGEKIVSLAPATASSIVKQLKNSQHVGFRSSLLTTLAVVSKISGDAFDDSFAKDVWKVVRSLVADKSAKLSCGAFEVLEALALSRIVFKSSSDFESFKTCYLKAVESIYPSVRRSAAKTLASICLQLNKLSNTKAELQPLQKSSKRASDKKRRGDDDEEEDDQKQQAGTLRNSKLKSFFTITFEETIKLFVSFYTLNGISTKVRTSVAQTICFFLLASNKDHVEQHYYEIARELLFGIFTSPPIRMNGYKALLARKHIIFILNDIICYQILGELGQAAVLKKLTSEILNNYPAVLQDQIEPPADVLISTSEIITGLIEHLGSAVSGPITDPVKLALLRLLEHPSHGVRIAACGTLRTLVLEVPSLIIPLLTSSLSHVTKESTLLVKKEGKTSRIIGHAYLASILVSLTGKKPEHASLDHTSRVLTTATGLLKVSNANVDILAIHIQVAWLLISGLMPLGPSFVKIHLSQLLLLWKAALYKPIGKDQNPADKGTLELCYHLHVRHAALGSIASFLAHNSKLVTADVARRIGVMLQNTVIFQSAISERKLADDEPQSRLSSNLTLHDYHTMSKRRILQCYLYLSQMGVPNETFTANLLTSALASIADPDKTTSKLSTAIASSTGSIDSIWEVEDNNAYGITSKVQGYDFIDFLGRLPLNQVQDDDKSLHWLSESADWCDELVNRTMRPVLGSKESDPDSFFFLKQVEPVPAATSVVDLSIELFNHLLPSQTAKVQESILDQMRSCVTTALKKTTGGSSRSSAVIVNCAATVYGAAKVASRSTYRKAFESPKILSIIIDISKRSVTDADPYVRNLGAQSLGIACSIGGANLTSEHIKLLIDDIVAKGDPNTRGGSSIALAYILKHAGGMFAGMHLKTVLGILVSLAGDPHPTVHFWALEAISVVIASSGLSFASYLTSTLASLHKLFLLESHSDEGISTNSTNLDVSSPTSQVIARAVRNLINVFGPDLRDLSKNRVIVLALVQYFELSQDARLEVEAHRSIQELIIFAPNTVNVADFAKVVHKNVLIQDQYSLLRNAAIDGLYQLVRTYSWDQLALLVGENLDTDIWLALDTSPTSKELRRFIENWLVQTVGSESIQWLARLQNVLLKTKAAFSPKKAIRSDDADNNKAGDNEAGLMGNEEGAAEDGNQGSKSEAGSAVIDEPLRWQTRELAVLLLRNLVHLTLNGKSREQRERAPIVSKAGELIKIAFSASTASVLELRLLGLRVLDDILNELKDLADPDFTEVALLEQYQAQIGSALTPAFAADSSPELAIQAIKVSATFIGSGIIKNVDRMGRIVKLLTSALESCSNNGSQTIVLGELKCPSPNAQVMLKVAVLSLWAELQVSSVDSSRAYLVDLVRPHVPTLVPLWISSLRDFARLRFEPEQSSGLTGSLDQMYSALTRVSILPIYQEAWLQLVDAIASLIEKDSRLVFDILDEKERASAETEDEGIKYSNEPAAFFFVLFGLCFEALARPQGSNNAAHMQSAYRLKVLLALKRILHPSVSGTAIYKDLVFAETVDMLDRIVLTGKVGEQQAVVEIVTRMCLNHPGRSQTDEEAQSQDVSDNVAQLFELFRVVMLATTSMFPFLAESDQPVPKQVYEDQAHLQLMRSCLDSLVSMIGVFPNIIKVDLYACLLYVFGRFLEDPACQKTIVPYSLVVQKKLLVMMMRTQATCSSSAGVIERAVTTAISQIVSLLKSADMSESGLAKRKNCLLSSVIVLTTCTNAVESNGQFIYDLTEQLLENIQIPEMAQLTSECTRTLLVSCIHGNIGKVIAEKLVPSLVTLSTSNVERGDGKPDLTAKYINDVLVGFVKGLKEEPQVASALLIAIPSLIQFIGDKDCGIPPEQRLAYVRAKLMELAGHDAESFKKIVQSGLTEWQHSLLEKILREGQQTNDEAEENEDDRQTGNHIQLKSFG